MRTPSPLLLILAACAPDSRTPHSLSRLREVPVSETSDLVLTGSDGNSWDYFGSAVASGDFNGDGYDDLLVGAYGHDPAGALNGGQAYMYLGTASGLDATSEQRFTGSDVGYDDAFGSTGLGLGDIDGDGYDDVAIGGYEGSNNSGYATGAVYIYRGSASGIDTSSEQKVLASDGSLNDDFGISIGAGDINADGWTDLIVGARDDDGGGYRAGAAYVYLGSSAGIDTSTEVKLLPEPGQADLDFGLSVSIPGDLDGDGYDDVAVGAPDTDDSTGVVHLYSGSKGGVDLSSEVLLYPLSPEEDSWFGFSLAGAGDIDGDGTDELLVGAPRETAGGEGSAGAAYLYLGSAAGLGMFSEQRVTAPAPALNMGFGGKLARLGDTDGDGHDEVAVSGYLDGDGQAFVFRTDGSGIVEADVSTLRLAKPDGESFGRSLTGGDLNGDGYADLALGATGQDSLQGAVHTFSGIGIDEDKDGITIRDDCDDTDAAIGAAEAAYADFDGDGFGDVSMAASVCPGTAGYTADSTDCDDNAADTYPGAEDTCGDGVDSDCDGVGGLDTDEDGDGLSATEEADLGTDACDPDTDGDGLTDDEDPYPLDPDAGIPDTGEPSDPDTGTPDNPDDPDTGTPSGGGGGGGKDGGCSTAAGAGWLWLLAVLPAAHRRRRSQYSSIRYMS